MKPLQQDRSYTFKGGTWDIPSSYSAINLCSNSTENSTENKDIICIMPEMFKGQAKIRT